MGFDQSLFFFCVFFFFLFFVFEKKSTKKKKKRKKNNINLSSAGCAHRALNVHFYFDVLVVHLLSFSEV